MFLRRYWLSMMPMDCRSFSSEDLVVVVVTVRLLAVVVEAWLLVHQPCGVVFLVQGFLVVVFGFLDFLKNFTSVIYSVSIVLNCLKLRLTAFVVFAFGLCHLDGYIRVDVRDDCSTIPFQL